MKPKAELRDSQLTGPNSMERSESVTLCSLHKYNLRSKGPPRYVEYSDQECPICLEDFNAPVIVNCGHSFCKHCIEKCMKMGRPAICPICKDRLVKKLFLNNLEYSKRTVPPNTEYRRSISTIQEEQITTHSLKYKQASRRTVV